MVLLLIDIYVNLTGNVGIILALNNGLMHGLTDATQEERDQ